MSISNRSPGGDPARARLNLIANCYYHGAGYQDNSMAHYLCEICGRALCDSHRRAVGGRDRCPDCALAPPQAWWICGRCGALADHAASSCEQCAHRDPLVPRLPTDPQFWEQRYRGHSMDAAPLIGGVVAATALVLGVYPALAAAARSPDAGYQWIIYLVVVSLATGLVAALIDRQRGAFELILSESGVTVRWKHRRHEVSAPWDDLLGLELSRGLAMAQFRLFAPAVILPVERTFRGYRDAVTRIRQHAAVAPEPFRAW